MKRLLLLALCALLSANADARTLYVDATRPNNNGGGLSRAKAKKTIQAAVNVAKKGDTILVYPGKYKPIKTKNRKIAIKSVKGAGKTSVKSTCKTTANWCLDLGKWKGSSFRGGKATRVKGFHCFAGGFASGRGSGGSIGGSVSRCAFEGFRGDPSWQGWENVSEPAPAKSRPLFHGSSLSDCVLADCYQTTEFSCLMSKCSVQRTDVRGCSGRVLSSTLCNSLVCASAANLYCYELEFDGFLIGGSAFWSTAVSSGAGLFGPLFDGCVLCNCTLECFGGGRFTPVFRNGTAANTIFWKVPSGIFSDPSNSFSRCRKGGSNPGFVKIDGLLTAMLKKGSPCIDKGRLTAKQKKLAGKKDFYGRKRIKGKAVDIGCFEY